MRFVAVVGLTVVLLSTGCSNLDTQVREDVFWARLVRHRWQGSQPDALRSGYRLCRQNPTVAERQRLLKERDRELAAAVQRKKDDIVFPQPLKDLRVIERAAFSILCHSS